MARCLIQAGADLNVRGDFYNTPFHCYIRDEYGTRVGRGDEFDFNIELVNLSSMCDVATSPECPDGFVHLVKKPGVNAKDGGNDRFFDENGTLLTTAVCFLFHPTWLKVVSWQKFWDTEPLFEITNWPDVYEPSPKTCKLVRNIK